jgi:predicted TIM-barrel fold metal-dependent hydrolase
MRTVNGRKMRIVDAHTHLSAERCAQAVQIMERIGLDVMIDVSPNLPPELERKLEAFAAHPGKLFACCGVDPAGWDAPGWTARECRALGRAAAAGAVGVKIPKEWGLNHRDAAGRLIVIDDKRLDPVYGTAGSLGLPVVFHTADPRAFFDPVDGRNERREELGLNPDWSFSDPSRYPFGWWQLVRKIEKVIARHPECVFVGAHFGCAAEEPGYVAEVLRDNPRYHADIAARIGELGRHRADAMRRAFVECQDRILFGTDMGVRETIMLGAPQAFEPSSEDVQRFYQAHWRWLETGDSGIDHPTPIQGRWPVDAIRLPTEALEKLYAGNAARVFLRARG